MTLADVRPVDALAYAPWRRQQTGPAGKPIGPARVNRDTAHMKAFFSWLVETEHLASNPLKRVKMLREFKGTEPIRIVAPARFDAVVAELERRKQAHWAHACRVLLATGMRWSSLRKLRPEHLDASRRLVRLVRPKGKRDVELEVTSPAAWASLAWVAADGAFTEDSGSFTKAITVAAKASGVPRFTPHMLRHTFAVRALDGGAHVRDVQRWLGHDQITTTERYLRHAKPKALPEMLDGEDSPQGRAWRHTSRGGWARRSDSTSTADARPATRDGATTARELCGQGPPRGRAGHRDLRGGDQTWPKRPKKCM